MSKLDMKVALVIVALPLCVFAMWVWVQWLHHCRKKELA